MLQAILGTATRTVTVVDTTAPVITVTGGTDTVELRMLPGLMPVQQPMVVKQLQLLVL